jgi:hypothetical protein
MLLFFCFFFYCKFLGWTNLFLKDLLIHSTTQSNRNPDLFLRSKSHSRRNEEQIKSGMLNGIWSRKLCPIDYYLKTQRLIKHIETQLCLFYKGFKLSLSHYGKNIARWNSITWWWGIYLGLRGNCRRLEKVIDEPDKHWSPNLIRVTDSKGMSSEKHKASMREKRNRYRSLVVKA